MLVPKPAVGPVGVPVNAGLLVFALEATAEAIAVNSVSISAPLIILPESPLRRLSLAVKLVAFT